MDQETTDLITGVHSIKEALLNEDRKNRTLYLTNEAYSKLRPMFDSSAKLESFATIEKMNPGDLQSKAQQLHKELGYNYNRVSGGLFLVTDALIYKSNAFLYDLIEQGVKKLLVLDPENWPQHSNFQVHYLIQLHSIYRRQSSFDLVVFYRYHQ